MDIDIRLFLLVLSLIGTVNLRGECLCSNPKRYLWQWLFSWIIAYVVIGFIAWLFSLKTPQGLWPTIHYSLLFILPILTINNAEAYSDQEDEFDGTDYYYSELPFLMVILGTVITIPYYFLTVLIWIYKLVFISS